AVGRDRGGVRAGRALRRGVPGDGRGVSDAPDRANESLMTATREDEQRRRAERRGRRRERNADQTDTAAKTERTSPHGGGPRGWPTRNEPQRTIKPAARTAVAGATAAGLAGAGTAWLNRRRNVAPRERDAEPEAVTHDEADIGADATQAPESHAEQAQ